MQPSESSPSPSEPIPRADLARLRIRREPGSGSPPRTFPVLRVVAGLALLTVLFLLRKPLLGLLGDGGGRPVRMGRATRVVPGQATQGDVAANGYIVADTQASLASVLSGRLVELYAAEGDLVEAGAVVARIQYDDLEARLAGAHAATQAAEASSQEAQLRTASARARVAEARSDVEAARLTSKRLALEVSTQEQLAAQALEESQRLDRVVERNRTPYERKLIDTGAWDQIQTQARAAHKSLAAARARARALQAAAVAWGGQIRRRESSLSVAQAEVKASLQAEAVAAASLSQARQAEKLAGIQLEKTRIRAPFRGLVIRKDAEKGEVIAPTGAGNSRGSVLTIVDPESLEVQVELSERRIGRVHEGDRALAFLDAQPDRGLPGVVRKIWPRADRAKGTIEVRVALTKRPASLRPEMAARVVFKGPAPRSDAPLAQVATAYVTVPRAALLKRGTKTFVFVVQDGVARLGEVKSGQPHGGQVVVLEGLEGTERVVLDPPADLHDGSRVREAP